MVVIRIKLAIDFDEIYGKPEADFYVDDKALRFSDWRTIAKQVGYTEWYGRI